MWWPDLEEVAYWPEGITREETVDAFVQAYRSLGYEPCKDARLEHGVEKIAIYAVSGQPTHVARQLANGMWSSKLGPQEDIEHDYNALEGPAYGSIVFLLGRARTE
jgi:hypothetical protein